jgi:hypothetical protein
MILYLKHTPNGFHLELWKVVFFWPLMVDCLCDNYDGSEKICGTALGGANPAPILHFTACIFGGAICI